MKVGVAFFTEPHETVILGGCTLAFDHEAYGVGCADGGVRYATGQ